MPNSPTPYPPIADYALLSDCHSSALVSRDGSVDWACLRRFDADSSFGRLLDWDRGGCFVLRPAVDFEVERRYIGDSLMLETTFRTAEGTARLVDAFSMHAGGAERPYNQLLRLVEGVDGSVPFQVHIEPRFDYGELRPWLRRHEEHDTWSAVGGDSALVFSVSCPLELDQDEARLHGELEVGAGERARFAVQAQQPHLLELEACPAAEIDRRLEETLDWWEQWAASMTVKGPYAEQVRRSAVVLKGLTCAPTGAMVAAPTTSLPEQVGGERNWDYRYTWIRDSTLVLAAMELAGHPEAARAFRDFILRSASGSPDDMQIMYGIYGERYLPEMELSLSGYRESAPVRIGNGAFDQAQHDMYGQVLDAAYLWSKGHDEVPDYEWRFLRRLVDRAAEVWTEPDQGIWEFRTQPQHFTHSKVWCWVALDRGIRIAEDSGRDDVDLDAWRKTREEIREVIERDGVHADGHFVQHFDTDEVDASLLELPMVGFVPATDERMVATVEKIITDLADDGMVHRYRTAHVDDGLSGDEGTFLMCSFWLVDVLAMQGRLDEAAERFERLLEVGNDVGLYAEQFDCKGGQMLGNFPQAFTHMALINSAHQMACANAHTGDCRDDVWSTADRLAEREL